MTRNLKDYRADLLTLDRLELIDRAEEIAHIHSAYEDLTGNHEFSKSQLQHLLKFANPLEVAASHWPDVSVSQFDLKQYPLMTDPHPREPLRKFINVDVIASLQAIMKQVTAHYQTDFDYDKNHIQKAAHSEEPEQRNLLWLCRTSGTHLHEERDVFIKSTASHNNIQFYHRDCLSEKVVLYGVEITGVKNGVVRGNLYERDRHQYAELAWRGASPHTDETLTYSDGHVVCVPKSEFDYLYNNNLEYDHGKLVEIRHEAEDESVVQGALFREHERREQLPKGKLQIHLQKLQNDRIQAEADRIIFALSGLTEPNSPNKTHFAAAISPHFLTLASTQDSDRLIDRLRGMLHTDSLYFSKLDGEKGIFCFIKASADLAIKPPEKRPSIKEQLSAHTLQEKNHIDPKKKEAER